MPDVVKFKAFCIERYKYEHNLSGKATIRLFLQYGVLDYIGSFYDVLHTFGDQYIVEDIDRYIAARRSA
jgi:hypothetical protein